MKDSNVFECLCRCQCNKAEIPLGDRQESTTTKAEKHTPGSWAVSNSGGKVIRGGMVHPSTIATLETRPLRITREIEANAYLIASAPELLDWVKEVCFNGQVSFEQLAQGKDLIQKTQG